MPIYLVFALSLSNTTSMRAARVVITLYAIKLGAGPFAIGMLAAAFGLLPTLLAWFVGRLSDRYGARWLLIVGAGCASVGMLLPYFAPALALLYVAALLNGLSFAFYNVSLQHVVGIVSSREHRTRNFSNYSLVQSVTSFLGPLVAGFAIDHSGYGAACLYLVALSAIPIAMLMLWGRLLPSGSPHATSKVSLKDTLNQPGVWRVLAASSLAQSGNDLFQFYMPVYGSSVGLSASSIGSILAAFAAAAFVIRAAMSRLLRHYGEETVLAC
ncbi:MAG TPA: MFS transporter, partial [Burkholderiales bacterium]|nr:MFS transporter [Burkholderiales bacterium]